MKDRYSSEEDGISNSMALLEAHIPGLRRFARGLVRGDRDRADDLVQDSLERALSRWHQRRRDGNLRSWLFTILYHHFLTDNQRRLNRNSWTASLTTIGQADVPGTTGGQDETLEHRDLLRVFGELSAEQQAVLLLIGVQELSYAQAATILDVPIGTVMSRLSRGRKRIRQYMEWKPPQARSPSTVKISEQSFSDPRHLQQIG